VPTSSKSYQDWKFIEASFGKYGHSLLLFARAKNEDANIFTYEAIGELMKAHEFTVNLEAQRRDGTTVTFEQACKKLPGEDECYTPSFLDLWDSSPVALERARERGDSVLDRVTALHSEANIRTFAGRPKFDEDQLTGETEVRSAEAVLIVYPLKSDEGPAYDIQPAWNAGIAGVVDSTVLEIFHFSDRSFDDEVGRLVNDDIPLFAIGMVVITIFVSLTLGPISSPHRSRVLLGFFAIINVLLAVGAAYGLASLVGVKFPSIAALLPLIVLGVQVDSVIIFVDHLNAEAPADALEDRVGRALAKAGPAVLGTSLTTITAFATSTSTVMPAVAMFSSFAALSFTFATVVSFTFFLALLVLDERRLIAKRISFAPCLVVGKGCTCAPQVADAAPAAPADEAAAGKAAHVSNKAADIERVGPVQRLVRDYYAPALLSKPGAALAVLVFVTLGVLSALSIPFIQVGLPNRDVLPDDSYVIPAIDIQDGLFKGGSAAADIVFPKLDYNDFLLRRRFRTARHSVAKYNRTLLMPPDWLTVYDKYLSTRSWEDYTDRLQQFLEDDGTSVYADDIQCGSTTLCDRPKATRYSDIYAVGTGDAIELLEVRDEIEAVLAREGFGDAIVFDPEMLISESDAAIWYLTWTNMVRARACGVGWLWRPRRARGRDGCTGAAAAACEKDGCRRRGAPAATRAWGGCRRTGPPTAACERDGCLRARRVSDCPRPGHGPGACSNSRGSPHRHMHACCAFPAPARAPPPCAPPPPGTRARPPSAPISAPMRTPLCLPPLPPSLHAGLRARRHLRHHALLQPARRGPLHYGLRRSNRRRPARRDLRARPQAQRRLVRQPGERPRGRSGG
jgi:hypothetical protein